MLIFLYIFDLCSTILVRARAISSTPEVFALHVSVEAIGCEQLAQSRYAAAPGRGSNSRPLDHKSDALPLRHHTTQVKKNKNNF